MKKESKANLIFVIVLIGTMIPGITMLVRKKLNGDHTSAALPDPVPYALAYNQPPPTPPGLPRMEPAIVRDWVQRVMREKIGIDTSMLRGPDGPVVSDAYFTQWISLQGLIPPSGNAGGGADIWLLIWRDQPPATADDPKVASANRPDRFCDVVSLESLRVPVEVRHSLQSVGYIDPPQKVWLGRYRWHFGDYEGGGGIRSFKITHNVSQPREETLNLP